MKTLTLSMVVALAIAAFPFVTTHASTVTVDKGRLIEVNDNGSERYLTASGLDSSPTFSPDGQWVAFIRSRPQKKVKTGAGEANANQLWLIKRDGTAPRLLAEGHEDSDPKHTLADLNSPTFSPDGHTIYFKSAAWATSGAVHAIDLKNGSERFVTDGNSLVVMPAGKYKGYLIVSKHKYWMAGGSYDWYWLISPAGAVVDAIGPDLESIEQFKAIYSR
jgi:dipeptidyl aminopeptidase/acylaminoacyl peptidase